MLQLKKLFTPVSSMEAQEARDYLAAHPAGTYTILDVRQPGEYEEEHLPGARLIPLPQLADDYTQLNPEQPVIVHCAIGGRSRVAAQLLAGLGFKEVYNLAGGIKAYQGQKAAGPQELNLDLVRGDETPGEIITLAYGLEKGLEFFYTTIGEKTQDREVQELCRRLAQVEVRHEARLAELYGQIAPNEPDLATLAAGKPPGTLEGGFGMQEFMESNASRMQAAAQVLELAMMVETQALDLYLRFAERCSQAATRDILYGIAQEEKAHLASLGRLLEEKLSAPG